MIRLRKLRKRIRHLRLRVRRLREHHHMLRWRRVRNRLEKDIRAKHKVEEAHREGVDVSWGRPSPESLKEDGRDFICMYLNAIPGFGMTPKDVRRYSEADIDLVALFERNPEDALEGYEAGERHAKEAIEFAIKAGVPAGRPIFFAIDFDARGPEIAHYFIAINDVIGRRSKYRVGGYGSKTVVGYLFDEQLIEWGFQTYAWSHHEWDNRAHLRQTLIDLPEAKLEIGGSKVDYCRTLAIDFGQWRVAT